MRIAASHAVEIIASKKPNANFLASGCDLTVQPAVRSVSGWRQLVVS
jgi:hypothetical protein